MDVEMIGKEVVVEDNNFVYYVLLLWLMVICGNVLFVIVLLDYGVDVNGCLNF